MFQQNILNPSNVDTIRINNIIQIIGGSLFIALCAQIKVPLWFTPVPLTLQTLAAMIIGATLGARNGAFSFMLYLTQISAGFPVCAGGISDVAILIGPKAGYYYGMLLQTYLVGWVFERKKIFASAKLLLAVFAISFIQLGLGTLWLGVFVGWKNAPMMGFFPFIPGEILKSIAVTSIYGKLQKE